MKWFKYLLCFLFFYGYSQQPSHLLIGEDELAGINIYSSIQDIDNSIVLATNNGLFRYNTLNFSTINSNLVGDQSLFGLIKNSKGIIYCYNLSGQIFYIKNNTLHLFYSIPKENVSSVIQLCFDNNDNLFISCKKLLKIDSNKKVTDLFAFKSLESSSIAIDNEGKIYFYDNQNLYFVKNDFVQFYMNLPNKVNNLLKPYRSNTGSISCQVNTLPQGFIIHQGRSQNIKYNAPTNTSNFYHYFVSKNYPIIWLASSKNGVYAFNLNGNPLYNNKLLFEDYFISSFLEDNEGNTWLFTFGKGIIFIPNLNVIEYTNNDLLKKDDLLRITKKDNLLYFGGSKGSVYQLNGDKISELLSNQKKIEFLRYMPTLDAFFINGLVYDGNFKKQLKDQNYNKYDAFQSDKNSPIWYTTRDGLFSTDNTFNFSNYGYTLRSYAVLEESNSKTIWIASSTGLEYCQNKKYTKVLYHNRPIFSTNIIKVNDEVWVASSDGILIFKNQKLTHVINKQSGLLSNRVLKTQT